MDGPPITRTPAGRVLLGIGVLAVLTVVAAMAFSLVSLAGTHTDRASRTFPFTGAALSVDAPDAGVDVEPGDAAQVAVDRTITTGFRGASPSWLLSGSTLTLRSGCPTVLATRCESHYRIRLPADLALRFRIGDGALRLRDVRGSLDVDSSDGSVSLAGVSGDLRVRNSDGSVRASGLSSRHVSVRSSDGSVRLAFASAPDQVDVHSSDGSVRLLLPRDPAGYQVSKTIRDGSSTGDVPSTPGASRLVTVGAADGSVDVSYAEPGD